MGTTTKLSLEEFQKLQDAAEDIVRYELDEGELIVTPSPTARHNIVRYRLRRALTL
jgi:Uma2 family endonuclease